MNYDVEDFFMMPGFTIKAVIRKVNGFDVDQKTIQELLKIYNELNNNAVTKAYTKVKVPVLKKMNK